MRGRGRECQSSHILGHKKLKGHTLHANGAWGANGGDPQLAPSLPLQLSMSTSFKPGFPLPTTVANKALKNKCFRVDGLAFFSLTLSGQGADGRKGRAGLGKPIILNWIT